MAKDYANKKKSPHKKNSKSQAHSSNNYGTLLLLTLTLFGLIYLHHVGLLQQFKQHLSSSVNLPPKTLATHQDATAQKPVFEFYRLLSKNSPNVAELPHTAPTPTAQSTATTTPPQQLAKTTTQTPIVKSAPITANNPSVTTNKAHYILQVASYHTATEADNLKAKLVLLGYDVSITHFNNHGVTWYRVRVGPYASLNQARMAQQQLSQHKFKTMLQRG